MVPLNIQSIAMIYEVKSKAFSFFLVHLFFPIKLVIETRAKTGKNSLQKVNVTLEENVLLKYQQVTDDYLVFWRWLDWKSHNLIKHPLEFNTDDGVAYLECTANRNDVDLMFLSVEN